MHYRTATLSDLDHVVDAWKALSREQHEHGSFIDPEASEASMHDLLGRRIVDESVIIVEEHGTLLGFVCVRCADFRGRRNANIGFIEYLYVDPDFRGEGIGGELLTLGEERLFEQGADILELDVFESNDVAVSFYDDRGYSVSRYRMRKGVKK